MVPDLLLIASRKFTLVGKVNPAGQLVPIFALVELELNGLPKLESVKFRGGSQQLEAIDLAKAYPPSGDHPEGIPVLENRWGSPGLLGLQEHSGNPSQTGHPLHGGGAESSLPLREPPGYSSLTTPQEPDR